MPSIQSQNDHATPKPIFGQHYNQPLHSANAKFIHFNTQSITHFTSLNRAPSSLQYLTSASHHHFTTPPHLVSIEERKEMEPRESCNISALSEKEKREGERKRGLCVSFILHPSPSPPPVVTSLNRHQLRSSIHFNTPAATSTRTKPAREPRENFAAFLCVS